MMVSNRFYQVFGGTGPVPKFNRRPSVHPEPSLLPRRLNDPELAATAYPSRPTSMPLTKTSVPSSSSTKLVGNDNHLDRSASPPVELETRKSPPTGPRTMRAATAPGNVEITSPDQRLNGVDTSNAPEYTSGENEPSSENPEDADKILFSTQEILALKLMFSLFDRLAS
jgi:hypothetical protein